MHEMADKGIAQTKDNFKNAKAATEEAAHVFQQAYTVAAEGTTDYNLKVFEIARVNTNAAFDYARALSPAIRNHDGPEQRTCNTGAEGIERDCRATQGRRSRSAQQSRLKAAL